MLTVCEEALWDYEVKIVLCPRHRDVKQAALLLELSGADNDLSLLPMLRHKRWTRVARPLGREVRRVDIISRVEGDPKS